MLRSALPAFRLARQPIARVSGRRTFAATARPQAHINLKPESNIAGISTRTITSIGTVVAGFGAFAGVAVIFFAAEIPRVRDDVMLKIPIVGEWFKKEIAPEDNPF